MTLSVFHTTKIKKKTFIGFLTTLAINSVSVNAVTAGEGVYIQQFSVKTANDKKKSTGISDLGFSKDGKIIAADGLNNYIKFFTLTGVFSHDLGGFGTAPGKLKGSTAVTSDRQGNTIVTNRGNNRIDIFSPSGELLKSITNQAFSEVSSTYIDEASGNLYVTDRSKHCIHLLSEDGTLLTSIGSKGSNVGQLHHPLRAIADAETKDIYIADSGNNRISVFSKDGQVRTFGEGDLNQPSSIYRDNNGLLYVADQLNNRVQIFDSSEKAIASIGSGGKNPGEFTLPTSLIADESNGSLFIADAKNDRIQQFFVPRLWNTPGRLSFDKPITLNHDITVKNGQTLSAADNDLSLNSLTLKSGTIERSLSTTITVNGDFEADANSTYHLINNNTDNSGNLRVTGKATLDGKLVVSNPDKLEKAKSIPILTADNGISGTFNSTYLGDISETAFIKPSLSYDSNNVYLTVNYLTFSTVAGNINAGAHKALDQQASLLKATTPIGQFIHQLQRINCADKAAKVLKTLNPASPQKIAASAINNSGVFGNTVHMQTASHRINRTLSNSLQSLGAVPASLSTQFTALVRKSQQGFNQLAQQLFGHSKTASAQRGRKDEFTLVDVKQDLPQEVRAQLGKTGLWIQQSGQYFRQKSNPTASGVSSSTFGFSAGADYELNKDTLIGIATGFAGNHYNLSSSQGNGDVNSVFAGIYGSWNAPGPGLFVDGAAFVGRHNFEGNRNIDLIGSTTTMSQSHRGLELAANLMVGYDFALPNNFNIQPHIEGAFQWLHEQGFDESGDPAFALRLGKRTSKFGRVGAGFELSRIYNLGANILRPTIKLGYAMRREIGKSGRGTAEFLSLPGSQFTVVADSNKQNLLTAGAGMTAMFGKDMYVSLNYSGEYSKKSQTHEGMLRFGWVF